MSVAKQVQSAPKCPGCGAPMAKRNSSRGAFWGCTTYPRCRGTRSIEIDITSQVTAFRTQRGQDDRNSRVAVTRAVVR